MREISTAIDWPCELYALLRDVNQGCKMAVNGSVSWLFENEVQGISLEDRCLPNQSC